MSELETLGLLGEAAEKLHKQRGRIEALEAGLSAAIRAANLALFVIRKKGVMPNDSWETGFECDMKTARTALEQDK